MQLLWRTICKAEFAGVVRVQPTWRTRLTRVGLAEWHRVQPSGRTKCSCLLLSPSLSLLACLSFLSSSPLFFLTALNASMKLSSVFCHLSLFLVSWSHPSPIYLHKAFSHRLKFPLLSECLFPPGIRWTPLHQATFWSAMAWYKCRSFGSLPMCPAHLWYFCRNNSSKRRWPWILHKRMHWRSWWTLGWVGSPSGIGGLVISGLRRERWNPRSLESLRFVGVHVSAPHRATDKTMLRNNRSLWGRSVFCVSTIL